MRQKAVKTAVLSMKCVWQQSHYYNPRIITVQDASFSFRLYLFVIILDMGSNWQCNDTNHASKQVFVFLALCDIKEHKYTSKALKWCINCFIVWWCADDTGWLYWCHMNELPVSPDFMLTSLTSSFVKRSMWTRAPDQNKKCNIDQLFSAVRTNEVKLQE